MYVTCLRYLSTRSWYESDDAHLRDSAAAPALALIKLVCRMAFSWTSAATSASLCKHKNTLREIDLRCTVTAWFPMCGVHRQLLGNTGSCLAPQRVAGPVAKGAPTTACDSALRAFCWAHQTSFSATAKQAHARYSQLRMSAVTCSL